MSPFSIRIEADIDRGSQNPFPSFSLVPILAPLLNIPYGGERDSDERDREKW